MIDEEPPLERFIDEAREHLMRLDGTLMPEFVQVLDGWYQERVVVDDVPDCVEIRVWSSDIPCAIICRTEPCHVPRYRTELRWIPSREGLL